ncbi:arylamine N-acetyltransferase [Streptomyces sp. NPDC004111]|uniref:arylamine N-acetyltransferase family protein n=1 Tax=Streptomyces sp. NPDC004111 TaxID=3364690 RepID=UPI0036986C50
MWSSAELDVDSYLARIGYAGDRTPTLDNLRSLHRGHVLSLGWHNLSSYLYGEAPLDLGTLQERMITGRGGGYCYEHVTLFAALLESFGYRFVAVQGRVVMGAPADKLLPQTHAMLVVEFEDGRRWLCDVGFGTSMLEPVEMVEDPAGVEVQQDGWRYWLRHQEVTPGALGWALHQPATGPETDREGNGWMVRHTTTLTPQYPVDFRTANHFVATSPHSPFTTRLYVQRTHTDRKHVLDRLTLTTTRPGSALPPETRELTPGEVPGVLAEVFGIEQSEQEAKLLIDKLSTS